MLGLLNQKLLLAAVGLVAASFSVGYLKGCSDGKGLERAASASAVSKANIDAFKASERRQRNVDEASTLAAARAADDRARAASADRVIRGLRDTLDATQLHAQSSLAAAIATVAAYRAVFESCTAEYRAVAEEAAGHARDSLMYQRAWPQ